MADKRINVKCGLCVPSPQLVDEELHKQHIRVEHLNDYTPFECLLCDGKFSSELCAASHIQQEHGGKAPIFKNDNAMLESLCRALVTTNKLSSSGRSDVAVQLLRELQVDVGPEKPAEGGETSAAGGETSAGGEADGQQLVEMGVMKELSPGERNEPELMDDSDGSEEL